MNVMLKPTPTLDEFLAWERQQERAYEFDGVRAIEMNGESIRHSRIAGNTFVAFRSRVQPPLGEVFMAGVKVIVQGRVRYPDVIVTAARADDASDIVPEPIVVVEVLSPSTQRTDRFLKNEEYGGTDSIQTYIMLEQDCRAAMVFTREGERWMGASHIGDAAIPIPAFGFEIPLAELYAGLDLEAPEDPPA